MNQESDDPDDVCFEVCSNGEICIAKYCTFREKLEELYKEADNYLKKEKKPNLVMLKEYNTKVTIYTEMVSLSLIAGSNDIISKDSYVMNTLTVISNKLKEENCNYKEILKDLDIRLGIINTKYRNILESSKEGMTI